MVHKDFGPAWRVTAERSLFDYGPGESADGFHGPDFATAPVDVAALPDREAAERLCADVADTDVRRACVLDVAVTGDARFAVAVRGIAKPEPASTPPPSDTTEPPARDTGVVTDGDRRSGRIDGPDQRDRYEIDLGDATRFQLVEVRGEIDARIDTTAPPQGSGLPGPYRFGVGGPGRHTLVVSSKGGPYSFRLVTYRDRQLTASVGDTVRGRLDVPGRVDVYTIDTGGRDRITLAGGSPCEDVRVGFADSAEKGVATPHYACWEPSQSVTGRAFVAVWSESGKPGDYSFRVE